MANQWRLGARIGVGIALGALGLAALPSACLYPDLTFNEPEPTGSGGSDAASSSSATSASSSSSAGAGGQGQGGGSASSSSSSVTTGVGGSTGGEHCLNGADDDDDGAVDCADSDCTPVTTCTSNVPFGWSGFATLFEGVPAQEPACPAAFPSPSPYVGHHTPVAGGATCSACGCAAPINQTCDLPDTFQVVNQPCGAMGNYFGNGTFPANWNGACFGQGYFAGGKTTCDGPCNVSVTTPGTAVTGGSCPPTGGVATVPALKWAIVGKGCGDPAVGGGCGAGKACLPKPQAPFLSGLCIYKAGEQACPAGEFTEAHVFYGSANDTRGCDGCTCGTPTGSSCTASIDIHSEQPNNTCTTKIATLVTGAAGGCVDLAGNPVVGSKKATITQAPAGGNCAPGGGQPKGSVDPSEPTTFCCAP